MEYIWAALVGVIAYAIYGAIWRLYLSPIAHFPGPRMAALTNLYEAYYNNWLGGKYLYRIQEMHDQYGPIVRISPSDLHVGDPEFYDILYPSTTSGRRANKSPSLTKFFGLDQSLFSTIDHDIHRMRRAALLPFFSTSYVRKMQPHFQERLDVLLRRISGFKDTGEAVNANCMFAAFSNDITQMLAFRQCSYKLETPNFDSSERDASLSGAQSFHVTKRIPWLNDVMMALPEWLVRRLSPALGSFMRQKRTTRAQVADLASGSKDEWSGRDILPIFRAVMDSPKLPPDERSVDRVAQDAQMLLMAGTLTQASILEHLMYWMVDNPDVLRKLKEELRNAMPSIDDVGKVPLTKLESLPYLTAVIKESVRLIYGNSTPHFRYDPDGPLVYEDKVTGRSWVIPPKTSVGMTSVLLHHNEQHFPNSKKFSPERWLGDEGKRLDKYNVGFGKGSRICVGMNQAYGVMRLVLAQIWRLWASPDVSIGDEIGVLSLYNTTPHDVQMSGDFFVAAYNKPQGVEFKVRSM
ncbi:cytochrome P450 [Lentithecium fluviatile CBS 122367]|uniref:Cytochrome P450 n=1 Tax=Lentithecium fluviatile CBS 122367 TaxID=1168545 RepID=A0A6G1JIU6_9PLEO|nr:cytochrome P450 [Lentithecium fluviatile CBS 122367]